MTDRRVGEPWLWFSRLSVSDQELTAILADPAVDVYELLDGGDICGMLELDRRESPDIEIKLLGVTPDAIGTGAGRFLIASAIEIAWSHGPRRLWLHSCTLDHPKALAFYRRAGFRPYRQALEIADDARLKGLLPRTAAPQVPIIE